MGTNENLLLAYESFSSSEEREWGEGSLAAIRRFTWLRWYKMSFLQFCRLAFQGSGLRGSSIAGLPRLHAKVQRALDSVGADPSMVERAVVSEEHERLELTEEASLGQLVCDRNSCLRVASRIQEDFPLGATVVFLGDDDQISGFVANAQFVVTVFDVDARLMDAFSDVENHEYVIHDIRQPIADRCRAEAVVLDPADGSVALQHWIDRIGDVLEQSDGARVYLSVNLWRLGKRWAALLDALSKHDLVPVASYASEKIYPSNGALLPAATDLWVFERSVQSTLLPHPYLDIEVFR